MTTIVFGAASRMAAMTRPMLSVKFNHFDIRIIAQVRFANECLGRNVRIVHLHEIDIHEERLVVLGVLLDIYATAESACRTSNSCR